MSSWVDRIKSVARLHRNQRISQTNRNLTEDDLATMHEANPDKRYRWTRACTAMVCGCENREVTVALKLAREFDKLDKYATPESAYIGVTQREPFVYPAVSRRIRKLMGDDDITISELSQATGVKYDEISRCVTRAINKPSLHLVVAMASYFNVTTDYLLGL